MWQALETKARFITQVMTGQSAVRRAEDIGGQELSYAEVKAIASGNPAVLTLAEADAELQRLAVLRKNHADEQYIARRSLRELPATITRLESRVSGLTADMATLAAHARDPIRIGGHAYAEDEAMKALGRQLNSIPANAHETRRYPIGGYRGLDFGLVVHPHAAPEVYLEGETTRYGPLSCDAGPRAVLNALDRLSGGYDKQAQTARQDLAIAEGQLRDYDSRLGAPFAHEAYLAELTSARDRLKASLAGSTPEPGAKLLPPAHEIADQIKAPNPPIASNPHRNGLPISAPQRPRSRLPPVSAAGSICRRPPSPCSSLSNPHPRRSPSLSFSALT
jgi:hypothetical protein